jgi:ribosomal protein RSM22 (predicted rRNA methylase)
MKNLFQAPGYIEAHGHRYVREDLNVQSEDGEFEAWWIAYPLRNGRRLGKANAQKHYRKARAFASTDTLLTSAKSYARSCGDYAVDPFRWLRDRRWLDEAGSVDASQSKAKDRLQFYADLVNSDRPLFNAVKPSLAAELCAAGLVKFSRLAERGLA